MFKEKYFVKFLILIFVKDLIYIFYIFKKKKLLNIQHILNCIIIVGLERFHELLCFHRIRNIFNKYES